jgi:hypothetical protein
MGTGKGEPEPPPNLQPVMTATTLQSQLKAAEAVVNAIDYNADGWEVKWDQAMASVRQLREQISPARSTDMPYSDSPVRIRRRAV